MNKKLEQLTQTQIDAGKLYHNLKNRITHPDGEFDKAGRWYPTVETPSLAKIRMPSRAFPYSYMSHCRTVTRVSELTGVDAKIIRLVARELKKENEE